MEWWMVQCGKEKEKEKKLRKEKERKKLHVM